MFGRGSKSEVKVTWNQREVYKFSIKSKTVTSVKDLEAIKNNARDMGAERVLIYTEENAVEVKYHRDAEPDQIYARYNGDYDLIGDDIYYADFGHGERVTLRCRPISEEKMVVMTRELKQAEAKAMLPDESQPAQRQYDNRHIYPDVKKRLDAARIMDSGNNTSQIKRVTKDPRAGTGVQQ